MKIFLVEYQNEAEVAQISPGTVQLREDHFKRLFEFLDGRSYTRCGGGELTQFFATLANVRTGKPLAIATTERMKRTYGAFWNWCIKKKAAKENAVHALPVIPKGKKAIPQVHPHNERQIAALYRAAKNSAFPKHNLAILSLVLDTGLRSTEICNIIFEHLDTNSRSITLKGKGDKVRTIYYGVHTAAFLWDYWRERQISPLDDLEEPVIAAMSGPNAGRRMTRSGIYQAMSNLCIAVGITDGKKGAHRLRHTFGAMMARAEAYPETIQEFLGHSDPKMTQRYVKLAKADMQRSHAKRSPVNAIHNPNIKKR